MENVTYLDFPTGSQLAQVPPGWATETVAHATEEWNFSFHSTFTNFNEQPVGLVNSRLDGAAPLHG